MGRTRLQHNGTDVEVDAGEVARATFTFTDYDNILLVTSSFESLTMTLRHAADGSVINSRDGTDILNASNGTVTDVSSAAVLHLILDENDNANISNVEAVEERWLDLSLIHISEPTRPY